MKFQLSKQFIKDTEKLPLSAKDKVAGIFDDVKQANTVNDLKNCKKLINTQNSFRIKLGNYRLTFIFVVIENQLAFQRILSRGEIYKKEYMGELKKKEKD